MDAPTISVSTQFDHSWPLSNHFLRARRPLRSRSLGVIGQRFGQKYPMTFSVSHKKKALADRPRTEVACPLSGLCSGDPRHFMPILAHKIHDEPTGVRPVGIVEFEVGIAAAPCMTLSLNQHLAQHDPPSLHIVLLLVGASPASPCHSAGTT